MKKIIAKIHLWIAFPVGLIITVLCLSGAILVFRTEIEEATHPERYFVTEDEQNALPLPLDELMRLAGEQLENDAATGITIPSDPRRTYAVSVASDFHRLQYINPYSGKLIKSESGHSFFLWVMQLHRWLLLNPQTGKPITGWTTLLFIITLISGAILIIPKNRKALKRIYRINLTKGWRRFWYDLHISAGSHCLLLLLILALTGLTWSFRWYSNGVYKIFGAEPPAMNRSRPRPHPHPADFTHWQSVLEKVSRDNPEFRTITFRNSSVNVVQNKIWGNVRATDTYSFDEKTAEITDYRPYGKAEKSVKIRGWLYTLHVGAWGGMFSKIITCIASLVGASLPLTGYYIWWRKRRRKAYSSVMILNISSENSNR
jgi:uncharacterized iron-regulated membrane protein